jgi:hypothetical protein
MRTKRFFLAVVCTAVALTFFACSDDKDDPKGACFMDGAITEGVQMCMEPVNGNITAKECNEMKDEDDPPMTFRDSCPSGEKLKCPMQGDDGRDAVVYLYYPDEMAPIYELFFTCEMLNDHDDDDDDD